MNSKHIAGLVTPAPEGTAEALAAALVPIVSAALTDKWQRGRLVIEFYARRNHEIEAVDVSGLSVRIPNDPLPPDNS